MRQTKNGHETISFLFPFKFRSTTVLFMQIQETNLFMTFTARSVLPSSSTQWVASEKKSLQQLQRYHCDLLKALSSTTQCLLAPPWKAIPSNAFAGRKTTHLTTSGGEEQQQTIQFLLL